MPDLKWNRRWGEQARQYAEGHPYFSKHSMYGLQWGHPLHGTAKFVVPEYIQPRMVDADTVLEIGPGGGRYTQFLLDCSHLILVEYNTEFFAILEELYGDKGPKLSFVTSDGSSLPGVPDQSVDFVFSFDCFVHLDIPLIRGYLADIGRVLAPDGYAVIHYADKNKEAAQKQGSNFSPTTSEKMRELVTEAGYEITKEDIKRISHSSIMEIRYRTNSVTRNGSHKGR